MDKLTKDIAKAIYKMLLIEHSKDDELVDALKHEKAVKKQCITIGIRTHSREA